MDNLNQVRTRDDNIMNPSRDELNKSLIEAASKGLITIVRWLYEDTDDYARQLAIEAARLSPSHSTIHERGRKEVIDFLMMKRRGEDGTKQSLRR
jgi:hypothetical protein